ncbi:PLP-dependent aminotransferase family protein [Burkholderia anthina]|uniref:MocR-like pyridoxine biosynthesis transcription factor PdxR n=1 Tax=Burkholderia anthina TaxID=179879 RepID=UPI00158E4F46|nr:PLP-dependent aminotransferase family protein [Burkholderia anthina]
MVASRAPKQSSPALLDLEIDRGSRDPIFRQIARQLRGRIGRAALPRGARLPPTRDLAAQLGVARNCVVEAYDEMIAVGLLEGRGRRGTFVASTAPATLAAKIESDCQPALLRRLRTNKAHEPVLMDAPHDWQPGQANVRTLPVDVWRNACREAGRHLPPQDYGDPRGDPGLRSAIVAWLREQRSVHVDPDQIVVTQGTGHALQLVAQTLLREGDLCATEDPGYGGAALAFARAGASLRYVPVDAEGILIEHIVGGAAAPLVVHVTPTHQYPLGGPLSGPRRHALIALAHEHQMLIVENEYDCEFHYAGTRHPPLFSAAPESTLLLNTFAKAVSPALRLGFIAAPPAVAIALAAHVERERVHVSWPIQKIVETLLVSGELDRHLRRVRRHYGAMRDVIRRRLAEHAGSVTLRGDHGGLHMVIMGRTAAFDLELRTVLRTRGIMFNEVRDFTKLAPEANGFLFGYGHMNESELSRSLDDLIESIRCVDANGKAGRTR